jgi:hypothetical protein
VWVGLVVGGVVGWRGYLRWVVEAASDGHGHCATALTPLPPWNLQPLTQESQRWGRATHTTLSPPHTHTCRQPELQYSRISLRGRVREGEGERGGTRRIEACVRACVRVWCNKEHTQPPKRRGGGEL